MYAEMMTNNDNVESSLLTSNLLKICSLGADPGFPIGGVPTPIEGGANLQHRCFSVKTCVKTKEFGPVGGSHARNFCM